MAPRGALQVRAWTDSAQLPFPLVFDSVTWCDTEHRSAAWQRFTVCLRKGLCSPAVFSSAWPHLSPILPGRPSLSLSFLQGVVYAASLYRVTSVLSRWSRHQPTLVGARAGVRRPLSPEIALPRSVSWFGAQARAEGCTRAALFILARGLA